jgi:hypothetical protein
LLLRLIKILVFILRKSFLSNLCIIILISPLSFSQDITGNLEGRVTDTTGVALSMVNVSIIGNSLQGSRGTTTKNDGYFQVLSLPVGEYNVKISTVGFNQINIEKVQVLLGKTTNLGVIILKGEAIALPEITVSGDKPIIDPVTTNYGGNLNSKDFEQLPVDRNYSDIATLLPQTNTSYYGDEANIGGATGFENKYFVDGVEVTDPLYGISGTYLPYNFIKEVEVKAGGYDVSSRSSLGGLINVITYSGSNEFHGSVFGFYTSNQLSENKRLGTLDVKQGDFSNYDIGVSLGGPIIRDELWFFAAYNPTFNRRDVEVPSFGIKADKILTHSFAGKLSWRATSNLNLILTVTGDPTQRDAVGKGVEVPPSALANPDPYLRDIVVGGVNYSLTGTYTIGNNILLNGLISRVDRQDICEGSTEIGRTEIHFRDYLNDIWSGGVISSWDSFNRSTVGRISGTFLLNNHNFNVGIEYKTNLVDDNYNAHYIFMYDSTDYDESIQKGFGEVMNRIPSAYFQDSWRVFERLNLTGGIRWDGYYLVGSSGEVIQTISAPLQPRISLVFILDENNDQRIYGSFGRFTQEFALLPAIYPHPENGYNLFMNFNGDPRMVADTVEIYYSTTQEVRDLKAQYYDEFSLGYERLIGGNIKVGVQGVYRTLRQAIDDMWYEEEDGWKLSYGNPGSGFFSEWPEPQRDYTALIFTIQRTNDKHFNNYEGLFDASSHSGAPHKNFIFDDLETSRENTTGLVPNDRTHVFKFSGYYSFSFGLVAGISFLAQSGTPLSEYAQDSFGVRRYLIPRSSSGRTPAVWDLNARIIYKLNFLSDVQSRLIIDLFHIASQRKAVDINQQKYLKFDESGDPINPNPNYGQAYRYQPSFSMRLGIEVSI